MVTDPTVYSVTIATIAFCGFSMVAIVRAFNPPPLASPQSIEWVLPEPPRPIGLLPAALAPELPVAPSSCTTAAALPSSDATTETPTTTVLTTTTANLLAGLLAAPVTRPTPTAIAPLPAAPMPPENPPLYRPVLFDGTTKMVRSRAAIIPSPWEPESDRYWNQNSTLTYPNSVPMLAGSAT